MTDLEQRLGNAAFSTLPTGFFAAQAPTSLPAAVPGGVEPGSGGAARFRAAAGLSSSVLAGNTLPPGTVPLAAVYAGHQFGVYVQQLGDGRAILLGDVVNGRGERYELQLKGAGRTPFSRGADGRAVLRSTIREYLASEAMHGLGIPTTRALAIVGSDQPVYREQIETAAVLTRLAPSHVRFGSFEFFHYRGDAQRVAQLADFVIDTQFPALSGLADRHHRLLHEVVERTARLVAAWQAQGFVHGVMNTDNMSILGLTLDYGPYGFLDHFEAARVFNHTDQRGRYAYANQGRVALWNLHALAEALSTLIPAERREAALARFEPLFVGTYGELMRRKLGLHDAHTEDADLVDRLLQALAGRASRLPGLHARPGRVSADDPATRAPLLALSRAPESLAAWLDDYAGRLSAEGDPADARQARMDAINPLYVLRTHLAERAIRRAADQRDYSEIERLRSLLARPFTPRPGWTITPRRRRMTAARSRCPVRPESVPVDAGTLRHRAQRLHQRQEVDLVPLLGVQAILDAHDVDEADLDDLVRGRRAVELADVLKAQPAAADHLVALGDLVLEHALDDRQRLLDVLVHFHVRLHVQRLARHRQVKQVLRVQQRLHFVEALGVHRREKFAHELLVLFGLGLICHDVSPQFQGA